MLTRVLLVAAMVCLGAAASSAQETKLLGLGIANHAVTQAELERGEGVAAPKFNTPAVAYAWTANLKTGDVVELHLNNEGRSLMHNAETLAEDKAQHVLLAGKQGVPAGGWPEGNYTASVKVIRGGKTLIEEQSKPMPFE